MGGRGSGSTSYGGGSGGVVIVWGEGSGPAKESLPLAGKTVFFGGNKTDTKATTAVFEADTYKLDHEELLFVDQEGFARGYFKGDSGSVSFGLPKHVKVSDLTATHNHPLGDGRSTGGTFSAADMSVLAKYGLKEIRATAAEGTYSLKPTGRANPSGFLSALSRYDSTVSQKTKASVAAGDTRSTIDIALSHANDWVAATAPQFGYEYTFASRGVRLKNRYGQTSLALD